MSTTISAITSGQVSLTTAEDTGSTGVTLSERDGTYPNTEVVSRDDLLAAVASELDVIIIRRDQLPKAGQTPDGTEIYAGDGGSEIRWYPAVGPADEARRVALAYFAVAEYLDAHPPVDEADVEALSKVLYEATADPDNFQVPHVARRLLAAGVRPPEVTR